MGRKKAFNIATPNIRTIYLGKSMKQKARFIELQENKGKEAFEDDIKAGAAIYTPFLEELKRLPTKYNIITAPTEEDGLRAVQYLAGIHAAQDGYETDPDDNLYTGEEFSLEYTFGEDEDDFNFELDDVDECDVDDEFEDLSVHYEESPNRIPVIPIYEVLNQEIGSSGQFGFGSFNLEMQNNTRNPKPWWNDCSEYSVCLIKNMDNECLFLEPEALSEGEISSINRFDHCEHVYILVVGDQFAENDYSISTAILDYTANCFRVDQNQALMKDYYKKLFLYEAGKHGFSLSNTLDSAVLAEKLSRIDKNHPCSRFEKVMKYLIHIKAPHTLKAHDFESLGLKKFLNAESDDDAENIDEKLVGMEDVKKQINNILNMQRYVKLKSSKNIKNSGFHNVHLFVGAPGTAKTTVAKFLAKKMQKEGLIRGNRFISITGAQLKGAFVGQTAPKVHALFQQYDAIFIDEAYSLTSGCEGEGGIDSYSQEALAQLAVELEEHATDRLVIFAGYGGRKVTKKNNLMYRFLEANPGISSRINSTIYFDSYTGKEMVEIMHRLASLSSLDLPSSKDSDIAEFFDGRRQKNDFGNGREARMLLEQCERHVSGRVAGMNPEKVTNKILNTIMEEDVEKAIADLKNKRISEMGKYETHYGIA